jgi:hypothetical protein
VTRFALLGAIALLLPACDFGSEPDTRPPNVVFVSVSASTGSAGSWQVPTSMRNEGGPGSFHVRFYALADEDPDASEVICAYTDAIEVRAGWQDTGAWTVPCQSRPLSIAVRSLQPETGEFIETDRAAIPSP